MEFIRWFWLQIQNLATPKGLEGLVNIWGPPWVGYVVLSAIIFSETGLLVGFFLPGDSLLFAAGFLASQNVFDIFLLNACLMTAAVLGDAVNYQLGLRMTSGVFEKGHMRWVKHEHLLAARDFYDRYGGSAIILARFAPLVRTFTPFVAGVARMSYRKFLLFNLVGGIGWVASMTMAGYLLGGIPIIANHFEKVVLLIVAVSLLPVAIGVFRAWRNRRLIKEIVTEDAPSTPVS